MLIKQLRALGVELRPKSLNDLLTLCMESWAQHGDEMAKQYGGSGAMHRLDEKSDSNLSFSSMMGTSSSNNPSGSNKEYVLAEGAQNASLTHLLTHSLTHSLTWKVLKMPSSLYSAITLMCRWILSGNKALISC